MIFSASSEIKNLKEYNNNPNYEHQTKVEIVNKLLRINGSMKEFSEDIGSRLGKAFNSKAGKKHGLSEVEIEMRKALYQPTFDYKNIDSQANNYISSINTKYLRKNVA